MNASRFSQFLGVLAGVVALISSTPAGAQATGARTGSPSLKAGYAFEPSLVPGGVTNTFSIDPASDILDVTALDEFRVSRRVEIVRNPGPGEERIRVEIGVSQSSSDPFGSVARFVDQFFFASDSGDALFDPVPPLGSTARVNHAGSVLLFTQSNLFVMLEVVEGPTGNLPVMAQEIYSHIKSLPSVAILPLPTVTIETFPVPGVTDLVEGQQQAFSVVEMDPSGGGLFRTYVATDGSVDDSGPNPVYKADSTPTQRLTVVVSTASLLSGSASLVFNVSP